LEGRLLGAGGGIGIRAWLRAMCLIKT